MQLHTAISSDGHIKLCDFGVSEFIYIDQHGDSVDLSSVTSGDLLRSFVFFFSQRNFEAVAYLILSRFFFRFHSTGTPAFLAPECCRIGEFHTKRADVWASGVSMYFMLFGVVPFTDKSEVSCISGQMRSIVEQPLSFPHGHTVSSEALQLLTQLLEKDPERRISLDSALLSPWITGTSSVWHHGLKRLPSGLPDNIMVPESSADDVRRAVININNWSILVKIKQIASRHVQSFRDRRKSQDSVSISGAVCRAEDGSVVCS